MLQARIAQTHLKSLGLYSGEIDGLWGPKSEDAAGKWLAIQIPAAPVASPEPVAIGALGPRTLKCIATLDPKVRDAFTRYATLCNAAAAVLGCNYVMISGHRTWDEQAALYKAHQAGGPHAVPAGYSMHNFKLAGDFGVFKAGVYLDGGTAAQQAMAEKVHHACGTLAAPCGLLWGGKWSGGSHDDPHVQFDIGHATPTDADRAKFKATGSIL